MIINLLLVVTIVHLNIHFSHRQIIIIQIIIQTILNQILTQEYKTHLEIHNQ